MTATLARPIGTTDRVGGNQLTGLGTLIRFALRRERIRIPVWFVAVVGGTMMTASSLNELYGQPRELAAVAKTLGSPSGLAMTGPRHYLDQPSLGGMLSLEMIGLISVLVGLMSIMIISRHTRGEEESGRAELIRSAVVGRHAQLAAALIVAVIANVMIMLGLGFGLAAMGIDSVDLSGALLYGAAHAAVGLVCAGVAAIAVQITPHARGAIGMALAVAGLAYVLRAAGDTSDGEVLSWLSPIGWAQRTYPFVDDTWAPLLLDLALAVLAAGIGFLLSTRRDVGAGLRATRSGRAHASRLLLTPVGHALRLQRGMIIGFAIGVFVLGVMYGSILGSVQDMLQSISQLDQALQHIGGTTLSESFSSLILVVLALIAGCFVVTAGLRPRSEEGSGRAEPLLSTGLSRTRWLGSHALVAAAAGTAVVVIAGLGFGLAGAASSSEPELIWKLPISALAYAPALWVVLGVTVALYGWLPRFTAAAWILVVYGFFAGYFGKILQIPDWMNDLSPFGHVPQLPAAEMSWAPEIVLTLIAGALVALGLLGFGRRDLELK